MKKALTLALCATALCATPSAARRINPLMLNSTAWEIVEIDGKATQRTPRVEFVKGQALGNTGCNGFEGSYVQRGEIVTFRRIIATQMGCPGQVGAQERALFSLLGPIVRIQRRPGGGLLLLTGRKTALLRRAAHCIHCNQPPLTAAMPLPNLVGDDWFIQSINGKPVSHPDKARISFTPTIVSATIGCNRMTGPYQIGKKYYLATGPLASTRMGCPPGLDAEERALSALLVDDPLMQAERGSREAHKIRLSSGQNEAIIAQIWYIGLD
jgi:heat shock protein HslJ